MSSVIYETTDKYPHASFYRNIYMLIGNFTVAIMAYSKSANNITNSVGHSSTQKAI